MTEIRIDRAGAKLLVEYHATAVDQSEVDRFVAELEAWLDGGARPAPGHELRHGWSTLRLAAADPASEVTDPASEATDPASEATHRHRLVFQELDGSGVADRWTRGVSRTLIATRLQLGACASFSLPVDRLDFPSLAQSSVICDELDPGGAVFLHRQDPVSERDSGWFFACQRAGHDHDDARSLRSDSLYAHACHFQAVLPFLAMPVGSRVLLANDGTVQEAFGPDDTALAVVAGSYLAERRGRTSRT